LKNVEVDGVRYVPENSETGSVEIKQMCGTTIKAELDPNGEAGTYINITANDNLILGIHPDQEIVLQHPEEWFRMKLYGGEETGKTAKALIKQWSRQLGITPAEKPPTLNWEHRSDSWNIFHTHLEKNNPVNPEHYIDGTLIFAPSVDVDQLYVAKEDPAQKIRALETRIRELEQQLQQAKEDAPELIDANSAAILQFFESGNWKAKTIQVDAPNAGTYLVIEHKHGEEAISLHPASSGWVMHRNYKGRTQTIWGSGKTEDDEDGARYFNAETPKQEKQPLKDFTDIKTGDTLEALEDYTDSIGDTFTKGNKYTVKKTEQINTQTWIHIDADTSKHPIKDALINPIEAPYFTKVN
jgi:hypothetical protein